MDLLPERAPDDPQELEEAQRNPTMLPQAFYLVVTEFDDPEKLLVPGVDAHVRILCGRLTPAGYIVRWSTRLPSACSGDM